MPTVASKNDLSSLAKLVELLQSSPGDIERACERGRIAPSLRLNGVSYFDDSQIAKIRKALGRSKVTR